MFFIVTQATTATSYGALVWLPTSIQVTQIELPIEATGKSLLFFKYVWVLHGRNLVGDRANMYHIPLPPGGKLCLVPQLFDNDLI